jgi:hypothetical protein
MTLRTLLARAAAAAATLAVTGALAAASAEAQTISACYTQKNGTMYRVGVPNTPAGCASTTHVKETWNVQGPKGDNGTPGVSGYQRVTTSPVSIFPGATVSNTITCPAGKRPISGFWSSGFSGTITLVPQANYPREYSSTEWFIRIKNIGSGTALNFVAGAICVYTN